MSAGNPGTVRVETKGRAHTRADGDGECPGTPGWRRGSIAESLKEYAELTHNITLEELSTLR